MVKKETNWHRFGCRGCAYDAWEDGMWCNFHDSKTEELIACGHKGIKKDGTRI